MQRENLNRPHITVGTVTTLQRLVSELTLAVSASQMVATYMHFESWVPKRLILHKLTFEDDSSDSNGPSLFGR